MLFFQQTVFECQVGHAFLQGAGLAAQILHLAGGRGTSGVTSQPALARLNELFRPGVVQLWAMPSLRHSSAMLSSPRSPSSTMRILSSAEKWRRVCRRMSFTTRSAGAFVDDFFKEDLGFIFVPSSLRRSPDPP